MNDGIQLLLAAIVLAGLSWVFWHFAGVDGLGILTTIAMAYLLIENRRLRRKLKESELLKK
jgi:predicted acyltransferase